MYSRRTCGLCDKARAVILAEQQRRAFEFEEIFVDGDDELEEEYGIRVPVVEIDGAEQFEFHVDGERFATFVRGRRGAAGWEGPVC